MSIFKDKQQNVQQSALILLFSTVIVKIIGALFKIPLSTKIFLGDLGYGYFSVAYDLFTPFYTLAISGLPTALSHIIAEFVAEKRFYDIKNTFKITKRLFLIFGIALSLIISLLAIPFVKLTDNSGNTLYSVYAVIPSVFLCFVISVYRGYYEGFKNMNPTAVSKIIEALGKLILGLGLAFLVSRATNNPAYAAGASMLGITIGELISALYLYINFRLKGSLITEQELESSQPLLNNGKTIRMILSIAIPLALSSLISSAVSVIDALTVRSLLSKDISILYEEYKMAIESYNSYSANPLDMSALPTYLYGLRSKAFTMFNLVPTLTVSFGVGALPVLTECWVKKDILGVKTNLNTIIKMISMIALPSGLAYIAVARPIMSLLYSSYGSVVVGGNLLTIFGLSAIFAGFAIPLTSVLQSLNRQFSALINIIVGVALKIIINYLLIGNLKYNIYGSVISTTVCYLYILIAHIYNIRRTIGKIGDTKNTIIKPLFASICSAITAALICIISNSKITVLIAIFTAVLIYIVVIFISKPLNKEEILGLPKGEKMYHLAKKFKISR